MFRWIAGLALTGLPFAAPAVAQEGRDVVVVTGSMIQSDSEYEEEFGELPYISLVAPADFVIFTVDLETATRSVAERNRELERTFTALAQRTSRTQGVTMEVGRPGYSSPLETAAASEAIDYDGERSRISLVLKFTVQRNDTFSTVRARAEDFIDDIQVNGRVEAVTGDDQYIGISDPKKHREDLLRKIAEDIRLLQSVFGGAAGQSGAPGISLTGLSNRVNTRPIGPLEIEMFIPYYIVLGQPLPQPPPR